MKSPLNELPGAPEPDELRAAAAAGLTLPEWRRRKRAVECAEPDPNQLEKAEQAEVVKVYRAHGCKVRNLSQSRKTKQAPGLPDLWVVNLKLGRGWWHETKRPVGGRYSPAQIEFRDDCAACGVAWVGGDRTAAIAWLRALGVQVDL